MASTIHFSHRRTLFRVESTLNRAIPFTVEMLWDEEMPEMRLDLINSFDDKVNHCQEEIL